MSNQGPPTPITKAAFARIVGVSKQMVGKGIERGRIPRSCLVESADGKTMIADVEGARRAWLASADHSRAPGYVKERAPRAARVPPSPAAVPAPPRPPPPRPAGDEHEEPTDLNLAVESAREKFWKANQAELDFREQCGELVSAKEMSAKLVDVATRCRTKLLGLPTRAKQQLPHLTVTDIGTLDTIVREALEELALELEGEQEREAAVG